MSSPDYNYSIFKCNSYVALHLILDVALATVPTSNHSKQILISHVRYINILT